MCRCTSKTHKHGSCQATQHPHTRRCNGTPNKQPINAKLPVEHHHIHKAATSLPLLVEKAQQSLIAHVDDHVRPQGRQSQHMSSTMARFVAQTTPQGLASARLASHARLIDGPLPHPRPTSRRNERVPERRSRGSSAGWATSSSNRRRSPRTQVRARHAPLEACEMDVWRRRTSSRLD